MYSILRFYRFFKEESDILLLNIVGLKCVAIGKKLSDRKQLCPIDPINRSIGLSDW